jgi:Double-GTPase 1
MSSSARYVIIGLPGSGKTTFLAALWHVVRQTDLDSALRLDRLDGDIKHLNAICDAWLRCVAVPRTIAESETLVSMHLKNEIGSPVTLNFPDLSGESFKLQWTTRQFSDSYEELLRESSGALLFMHPSKVEEPTRIDQAEGMIEEVEKVTGTDDPTIKESGDVIDWDPEHSPTQVQLVELLQFVAGREHFRSPFRLAILVSAWDEVSTIGLSPDEWVRKHLPLLDQYLTTNAAMFQSAIYGVSAQGGDYATQQSALSEIDPSKRVQLIGGHVKQHHDITEPVRWLLG